MNRGKIYQKKNHNFNSTYKMKMWKNGKNLEKFWYEFLKTISKINSPFPE